MKNRKAALWLCILLLGAVAPARAESVSSGAVALAEILQLARNNNPDIRGARKEWEMVPARVTAQRSWPNPEVSADWMGFSRSGLNVNSAEEKWYTIGQTVPFPGKLWLKGKAASHAAMRQEDVY